MSFDEANMNLTNPVIFFFREQAIPLYKAY